MQWDARIDRDSAYQFWLKHRDHTARELAALYPERAWRTWQERINRAKLWYPELWERKVVGDDAPNEPLQEAYKESSEIKADGTCVSDKLLKMSAEQSKDPIYLLTAHGFDPDEWELVSAKNAIWNVFSKDALGEHKISTLYSSKITAKPRSETWSIEDLAEAVCSAVTPIAVKQPKAGERLLELSFTDMHLGNSTLEWYQDALSRALGHIRSRTWQQVVLWVGSDFFHTDNFKNTTSNGTPQSSMWWPQAVKDGMEFIGTIIEAALAQSVEVFVYYVPGNHDESMAWMFSLLLEQRYPQAIFDTAIEERKVHVFCDCALGMTHGDEKTRRDLDRVFVAEFPQFAAAAHREVHMGHLHHEKTIDNFGVTTRSLPTSARTDKWHRETGFVGARKTFLLFEWEAGRGVTDPHYI